MINNMLYFNDLKRISMYLSLIVFCFCITSCNMVEKKEDDKEIEKVNVIEEEANDSFVIETPYCILHYPEKWKNEIAFNYSEETNSVNFYGNVGDHDQVHLFSICFNSDEGELLGYFDKGDMVVNVSLKRCDVTFDESWDVGEKNQIYAMQEELNYVIEMLNHEKGYVNP